MQPPPPGVAYDIMMGEGMKKGKTHCTAIWSNYSDAHLISSSQGRKYSLCVGCGGQIHDQYILRVAPNLEWHAACLKCCECQMFLDENCTCFVRDGKTFCKKDYVR
jgi:hypothetical protein